MTPLLCISFTISFKLAGIEQNEEVNPEPFLVQSQGLPSYEKLSESSEQELLSYEESVTNHLEIGMLDECY